jgi:phage internal scaffolding protein
MFIRNPYNYDTNVASEESALYCEDPSRTKQAFKEECDINTILKRFNVTGQLPVGPLQPQYGDFSGVYDYQTALNAVIAAQDSFNALPAMLRNRFANDPAAFVDFCSDESNREEMTRLGLVIEKATQVAAESPKDPE